MARAKLTSILKIRIEDELKETVEALAERLGIDLSTATREALKEWAEKRESA